MKNYMIDAFIPNTEYKTAICWNSDEKPSKSKIDEVLKICSDKFALMYGWNNNLFIENDDNAIPKDKDCENKYNEVLTSFSNDIKYNVYELIASNIVESDDLYDSGSLPDVMFDN